jgi:hypothetical protein
MSHLTIHNHPEPSYLLAYYLPAYKAASTSVEKPLQIDPFMQNKPNFRKAKMNVNKVLTKDYEKRTLGERGKNKPNSNPIKANSKPMKANKMPKQTQYKPNFTLVYFLFVYSFLTTQSFGALKPLRPWR